MIYDTKLGFEPIFKNDINQLNISEYAFYWPYGDRTKIESILKKESDGTFCLRRAKDDSLCLTFKHLDSKSGDAVYPVIIAVVVTADES